MPYRYVDPVQRVHQQRALRNLARPQPQYVQPSVQPLTPVQSPLQLGNVPEIIYGNGPQRRANPVETAIIGAAIGASIGAAIHAWIAHNRKKRGQNTTPGFRAFMVFLAFLIPGVIISASMQQWSGHALFAWLGLALGATFSVWYYRRTPKRSPTVDELNQSLGISNAK